MLPVGRHAHPAGSFSQESMPQFSIITVTYNAAETLEPTLRSVAEQTCADYEHLIIDGASTDATLDISRRYARPGLKLTSEPDNGIYDAMNRGLKLAAGDYVIFLNSGDTFHAPDTLALYAANATGKPGIIYGQTQIVSGKDRSIVGPRHLDAPEALSVDSFKNGMMVCHQAMAVRRDIAPLYDLNYRLSADYDWVIRCLQKSNDNRYINDILADYLDEGATTRNHRASLKERYIIMCHYYGTLPTIARHIKFMLRNLTRKIRQS